MSQGMKYWTPSTWPDPSFQPSLARVLKDQVPSCEMTEAALDKMIQDGDRDRRQGALERGSQVRFHERCLLEVSSYYPPNF